MKKYVSSAVALVLSVFVAIGMAAPAIADVNVREGKTEYLYVRAEVPTAQQLERQFAAFWNPNVPTNPKVENSYGGEKARPALERVLATSQMYDFFSVSGRAVGPLKINGQYMSVDVQGTMAGFPATQLTYYWIRENGLWKYDFKRICEGQGCYGNPNFGY